MRKINLLLSMLVITFSLLCGYHLEAKESKKELLAKPEPAGNVLKKLNPLALKQKRDRYLSAKERAAEFVTRIPSGLQKIGGDSTQAVDLVVDTTSVNWQEDNVGDVFMTGLCYNSGTTPAILVEVEVEFYDAYYNYLGSEFNFVYGGSNVRLQVDSNDICVNALKQGEYGFFNVWTNISYANAYYYYVNFGYFTGTTLTPYAHLNFDGGVSGYNYDGYMNLYGRVKNSSSNYVTYLTEVWFAVFNSDNTRVLDVKGDWLYGSTYNGYDSAIYPNQSEYFDIVLGFAPYEQCSGAYLSAFWWIEEKVSPLEEANPPFGSFDTPIDGSAVVSSIPVTGWALDDSGIASIKLYREQGNSQVYIGDAALVEGARPDVAAAYPQYPNNTRAGWGYMMLTNFLPNGGNGTFVLHAVATDMYGKTTTLGTKTIQCNNAMAVKPFGAIDTPGQGETISGSAYINWGWVLTPQPNSIPTNGSTVSVWVDGVNIGHPNYNVYREDIATFFPGYANSNGAVGYFSLDTTAYANGVHSIQWTARDSGGNSDGIGSRYFTIQNNGSYKTDSLPAAGGKIRLTPGFKIENVRDIPVDHSTPVKFKKGFVTGGEQQVKNPGRGGVTRIEIKELERLELDFSTVTPGSDQITGYLLAGSRLKSLPIGSTLDREQGKFYWSPGPGFLGQYRLVFIESGKGRNKIRRDVIITISPRFN